MSRTRLNICIPKLQHNIDTLVKTAHDKGVRLAVVSKVVSADDKVLFCIENSEADMLADARMLNLDRFRGNKPRLLLRIGSPKETEEIVRTSEISLQSELTTIRFLNEAAKRLNRKHKVILMIDLGDLREGIFFENWDEIRTVAQAVSEASNLELYGTGTNLTCYGSILPDERNLGILVECTERLREELHEEIPIISGGNSTSLPLLFEGRLPNGINHLRVGEAIHLGVVPGHYTAIPGLFRDVYSLEADIIECKRKPSMPIGTRSRNAFGEEVSYTDEGEQIRAILSVGRQDVSIDGLTPLDADIRILGASSDHLLVDLTHCKHTYHVGDSVRFGLDYGALLACSTSKYVERNYLYEV